jgi:hypothetical protein
MMSNYTLNMLRQSVIIIIIILFIMKSANKLIKKSDEFNIQ